MSGNSSKSYKFSTTQLISAGFLGVILAGAILLWLPVSAAEGNSTGFVDALFTSATSVCVTGLTTVSTANHWSLFGKIVILVLAQLGGLGVVACATTLLLLAKKRITLNERKIIRESYGLDTMEGMVKLIKRIVKGTIFVEALGAVFYSIQFIPEFGFWPGIWRAVFNAVSAFCNAGMDILGDTSLLEYQGNVLINVTTMLLVITGGIGFTVWWDLLNNAREIRCRKIRPRELFSKLSLHSKLALSITGILLVFGAVTFFIFEYHNQATLGPMSFGKKIMAACFQSVTTRTAGFFTVPQENFTNASVMISIVLMFIGGSPAGTAGGMKTTTVGMLILTSMSFARGKRDTEAFGRKIAGDNIKLGLAVVTVGMLTLFISMTLLCAVESASFVDLFYELTSAVATVGLSRSLTPTLSDAGKLIVIVVMYLGRIGPITLVAALTNKRNSGKQGITLPEKRIIVG